MNTKHGMCGTAEYRAWQAMINRCTNPRYEHFHCYGGRGIVVCQSWSESFETFFADMGHRPSTRHSLDRKNTNGNYEPTNCRWATKREQSSNMRKNIFIEAYGKRQTVAEWSRESGLSVLTLLRRLRDDLSVEDIFKTDPRHVHFIEHGGKRQSMSQWARDLGISLQTMASRAKRGLPVHEILSKEKLS